MFRKSYFQVEDHVSIEEEENQKQAERFVRVREDSLLGKRQSVSQSDWLVGRPPELNTLGKLSLMCTITS